MTIDDIENIEYLQSQKNKYEQLCEKEKNPSLKIIFRRMTKFYVCKINRIIQEN